MFGRYEMVIRLRAACAAIGLLVAMTCGTAAQQVEPTAYPQTAYAPVLLPTSWQPPAVEPGDQRLVVVDAARTAESSTVLPESLPSGEPAASAYADEACDSCRSNSWLNPNSDDFMWGCGGWPFQTGPGCCDTWKVGPVWDVSVDGMTLFRKGANLEAIAAQAAFDSQGDPLGPPILTNEFDYGGGARVYVTGTLPRCAGYRLQFGYEGVEEWNASVVFPKLTPIPVAGSPADSSEQRRVHLVSNMQSAEFNFDRPTCSVWRPYVGIRYMRFNDQLRDLIDQEPRTRSPPRIPIPLPPPTR